MKVGLGYGLWASRASLYFLRDKLIEAGFEPIWLDLNREKDLSLNDYFNQVERIVIKEKISLLIGHSMAGLLCSKVADQHPEIVDKLVLLAPAAPRRIFRIRNWYQILSMILNPFEFIKTWSLPSRRTLERLSFNRHEKLKIDWDYSELIVSEPSRVVNNLIFRSLPLLYVTCPTYFITGTKDRMTPHKITYRMIKKHFRSLDNTFSLAPGHDHFSILKSQEIAKNIIDFLKT